MQARYSDGNTVIDLLIGKDDLERLERQLPLAATDRLSGTGERVFVGYIEYGTSGMTEPAAEYDGRSINVLFPRHYRSQDVKKCDEVYVEIRTRQGIRDGRVVRLNVQPRRNVPL